MRLLAIDPGYDRCGVAVFDATTKDPKLLHSACITTKKTDTQETRLAVIYNELERLVVEWNIETIALETLFFSINKKTALKVAEARGVVLLLAGTYTLEVIELSPQEVKLAVAGSGAVDKKQVKKMVELLLKNQLQGRFDDEIDAIAIGLAGIPTLFQKKLA
ncbi:MAG TPA: crossover junction endodeoxyribonuclease RuvC [Candidatus Paceibacterota bacterium]|nr:crossover junction endodeoxyribonuclease RuvC [Candidatus Paceibacterota bacterium]